MRLIVIVCGSLTGVGGIGVGRFRILGGQGLEYWGGGGGGGGQGGAKFPAGT